MPECSVSIIIPAYNVEKYLKAALDSIKQQTQPPEEVILIDDGSTDHTLEIAQAYDFQFHYQVISVENQGQGNARNLGVSLAASEYVYFFDSDDLLTSNFIASIKQSILVNQYPDIVLFSGKSFNDSDYSGSRWVDYSRGFSGVFTSRTEFLDKALAHDALFCSTCLYVSKRSLWGEQGLQFGANFLEDQALFYPVLFACHSYVVIDEVFFRRRNREGSTMTMKPNQRHVEGAINCIETTLKLSRRNGLTPRELWHVRRLLGIQFKAYIVMARHAGTSLNPGIFLPVLASARSIKLLMMSLLYVTRADQSRILRMLVARTRTFISSGGNR